jgi:hypothetical protein
MRQEALRQQEYFEASDDHGRWIGTATLEAIHKAGLHADLRCIMYGRESLALDGWACRARTVA